MIDAGRHNSRIVPVGLAIIIVAGSLAAYIPAIRGEFIWDDDKYVSENPLLSAPDGLWRIWFSKDVPSQYFPMVYTTFRLEYALWGLQPSGYHLTNIILHIINALLLWYLLWRLNIRGAWLASAIFALHPVHTESVAWITERKNVLSLLFYLGSALAYFRYRFWPGQGSSPKKNERFYLLSIVLFLCALASKTVTCTLPAVLLIVCWWKRGRIDRTDLRDMARFFALGLAWGLFVIWWEHGHQGTGMIELGLTPIKRALIASRALWFYIGKLIWPAKLTFSYPPWNIDATDPLQYSWMLGFLFLTWAMWHWRGKLGRAPIATIAFFAVTLSPMLGFFSLYTFLYTFVADHYQYVASIAPITLFVGIGCRIANRFGKYERAIAVTVAVLVLGTLGTLTWQQNHIYKNRQTLWEDTIDKNPDSYLAHTNLGIMFAKQRRSEEAIGHFHQALRIKSDYAKAHNNLGIALVGQGDIEEGLGYLRKAVKYDPDYVRAYGNLARILATTHDAKFNSPPQAIELAMKACELTDYKNPIAVNTLAIAYAAAGRFNEAIVNAEKALKLAQAGNNHQLANQIIAQLEAYKAKKRYWK